LPQNQSGVDAAMEQQQISMDWNHEQKQQSRDRSSQLRRALT